MANTLIPIQTYTLSSSAASVTFSNIPQNYTDLKLVASSRSTRTGGVTSDEIRVGFNGLTTNQSTRVLQGAGSGSPGSYTDTRVTMGISPTAATTSNTFGNAELYIPNYTSSNNKSSSADSVSENNATTAYANLWANLWSSDAAITSIELTCATASFDINSTFTLYGVSNGVKATGGTLTVAGGYAYHTFTSTGSFLPSQQIKGAEFLVIAGGGGGNYTRAGGGGAGGLLNPVAQTLNAGNTYTALIGAGGTAGSVTASTSGSPSVFANYTAIGGGRGGGAGGMGAGLSGGSGGGGGEGNVGGAGTQGQGNNGSDAVSVTGGAGGGAGAVGGTTTSTVAGTGGIGLIFNTWGAVTGTGQLVGGIYYYAGGGGGGVDDYNRIGTVTAGAGGLGGGGRGQLSVVTAGTAGTANTGGGGGGGGGRINEADGTGQPGGSGLIIIRYPLS